MKVYNPAPCTENDLKWAFNTVCMWSFPHNSFIILHFKFYILYFKFDIKVHYSEVDDNLCRAKVK